MTSIPQGLGTDSQPDTTIDARKVFGLDITMKVPAFSKPNEYVPERDHAFASTATPRLPFSRALLSTGV
jgi:cobaltochelatase CobS